MTNYDYKIKTDCIAIVKDRARVQDSSILQTMLDDTSGKNSLAIVVFRPYWVASVLLDQKLQQLEKAEGAEFRDLMYNVKALREYQWSVDSSMNLTVPENTSEAYFAYSRARRKTQSVNLLLV